MGVPDPLTEKQTAATEAALLLAFERLCRSCQYLWAHPRYTVDLPTQEGEVLHFIEEALDEGPVCSGGLKPLTSDGSDCPYFKALA